MAPDEGRAHPPNDEAAAGECGGLFDKHDDEARVECPSNIPEGPESQEEPEAPDDGGFDWNDDYVVIERQPRTACYLNKFNQVVIRQEAWPDEDPFIVVSLEHIPALIAALEQTLGRPRTMTPQHEAGGGDGRR